MNFFPIPYPDEILSSILARYSVRSGNMKIVYNLEDIFGTRNMIAVMELPTKINALVGNLPFGTKYTSDYFIYNHTLFPYYAAFIPEGRGKQIISSMKTGAGDVYMKIGAVTSRVALNEYYKFCPQCVKEDTNLYGEAYWHRLHQTTGVFVCSKHQVPLHNSRILVRGGNRQIYHPALHEYCIEDDNNIKHSPDVMDRLINLAQDIEILLNNNLGYRPSLWFKNKYRSRLVDMGYAKLNNTIHQKKLSNDISEFYGEEFLELVQCSIPIKGECKWISDIVRDNEIVSHTLRHLLLARFLSINLYDLFDINGEEYSIGEDGEVSGISKEDIISNKDFYCKVWEERLKELIEMGLSLRQIAKELNSTSKTIKKHIARLGIEPFWKYNGGKRYGNTNYLDTEEFKNKQKESRRKWINLINQNPNKSRNELKLLEVTLGTWFLKYDKEWMLDNSPLIKSNYKPIDWNKRDEDILPKVKCIVEDMKIGKPERVCFTTIGSKLGISGWLSKKKKMLPLTNAYIDLKQESIREFQIRKIKWAVEELVNEGFEITYWRLLETAGVKERYIDSIEIEVEEILENKGFDRYLLRK